MELRYRARAGDHNGVALLANPEQFQAQFIAGRNPADIRLDTGLAITAAGVLRKPDLLIDMILTRQEVNSRSDSFGDGVFSALIELGDLRAALGLINADISLTSGKQYELVDAFLT